MDLFDYMKEQTLENESPLASRMRPVSLEEVVGQEHIIGKGKLLYRAIKADKLSSIIFLRTSGNRKDNTCKGDCKYNKCKILSDECDGCRKERHGRSRKNGTGLSWNVRKKDDFICR